MAAAQNAASIQLEYTEIVPDSIDENKNPILYIHTVSSSKELWPLDELKQIAETTKRRSFVLDSRCHGDSPHKAAFSPDLVVEDLLSFMQSKNFEKAVLVGHGLGGIIVSLFALRHPQKVEMMINVEGTLTEEVLWDTNKLTLQYLEIWANAVRTAPKNMSIDDVVRRAYDEVYANFSHAEGLEPRERFYRYTHPIKKVDQGYDVKHSVPTVSAYLNRSANREEVLNLEGTFNGPALFMMASNSRAKEGLDDVINDKFLQPSTVVLEATHHIHLLFPQAFVNTFLAFHNLHTV